MKHIKSIVKEAS